MTLQKWIKDRAIHGYPTFSIEDVRESGMYSSEQIMKNELNRLCSNKTIVNVYRGFYVIIPVHYVLRGSVPATYYIDQLMTYLSKPYYVCMLSAAELRRTRFFPWQPDRSRGRANRKSCQHETGRMAGLPLP